MFHIIEDGSITELPRVCAANSKDFNSCKYWLTIFSEGTYTIYGLQFNPFDTTMEHQRDDNYSWATNEECNNALSALIILQGSDRWVIVERVHPRPDYLNSYPVIH